MASNSCTTNLGASVSSRSFQRRRARIFLRDMAASYSSALRSRPSFVFLAGRRPFARTWSLPPA
eukprot:14346443-Alexandrium_andersonii.AAC.1